ncbi:glycosyltransferase [Nocardioides sp.]|uniref:glycosyltransferase family 2 protein n=1 Tax=Nocardioides sp. TaxID=35761 RepID=UPI0026339BC6|nr:glycosyltransferase [Nocardioides sp.]
MGDPDLPCSHLDIMIPFAGSVELLREAVVSVLNQSDPNWRLNVVEDGLQDASVSQWLTRLGDPRIVHTLNEHNLGVARNFQRCLELSTADYVTFMGCDDRLLPDYVRVVRRSWSSAIGVDVVQPGVRIIDHQGLPTKPLGDRVKAVLARRHSEGVYGGEALLASLMIGNWTYFPSLSWRRSIITKHGFRKDLGTVLDLALLAQLVMSGSQLFIEPEIVFEYRRHPQSVSSLTAKRADRFVEERRVTADVARTATRMGWRRATHAAQIRLTSRLHAALLLARPEALRAESVRRELIRHVFFG